MLVHASWSPRPLEPGDAVFLEVPGCVHRYHAAFTRAAWIGEPPPHARRVAEVGAEALAEAKAAMRPGIPAAAVFEAGRHRIDAGDVGYTQGRRLGYALGTAFPPRWDEGHIINLNRNEPRPLEPGMVFHKYPPGPKCQKSKTLPLYAGEWEIPSPQPSPSGRGRLG